MDTFLFRAHQSTADMDGGDTPSWRREIRHEVRHTGPTAVGMLCMARLKIINVSHFDRCLATTIYSAIIKISSQTCDIVITSANRKRLVTKLKLILHTCRL